MQKRPGAVSSPGWARLAGMAPEVLLAAVSLIHAGFQCVVTVVVYPALIASPVQAWTATHSAHSHRMALLVAPLYLALLVVCLIVLIGGPWTLGTAIALAGNGVAGLTTALSAGPTHGRLSSGRTDVLVGRLIAADRVRFAGALVAGAGGLILLAQS